MELPRNGFNVCLSDPLKLSYSCELQCGCWELDLDRLQEQALLLAAELAISPAPQKCWVFFFKIYFYYL